jgi:hypothetical protein
MDETIKRIDYLIKMAVEQGIEVEPFGAKFYTLTDEEIEEEDEELYQEEKKPIK